MSERRYTGSIVPEGTGGFWEDQSNTPQPILWEQEGRRNKIPKRDKQKKYRLFPVVNRRIEYSGIALPLPPIPVLT
jgi:hypothetical protein